MLRDAGLSPLGRFPGGSRAFGQDWACARFMGERSASGPAGGAWRLGCFRARARRGRRRRLADPCGLAAARPVADAGSYGASRGDADSNRRLDELPSDLLRLHARSDGQTRRANRVASGFRKLETLQQHPLAPTALTIDRCGGGKTQAHSDGERAAREISAAGEPVERAANHARPGGGARCARAARLQWQQPLGHKKAGAAECLSKYREGRRARRAEI